MLSVKRHCCLFVFIGYNVQDKRRQTSLQLLSRKLCSSHFKSLNGKKKQVGGQFCIDFVDDCPFKFLTSLLTQVKIESD